MNTGIFSNLNVKSSMLGKETLFSDEEGADVKSSPLTKRRGSNVPGKNKKEKKQTARNQKWATT
jgi:hypothetical protein